MENKTCSTCKYYEQVPKQDVHWCTMLSDHGRESNPLRKMYGEDEYGCSPIKIYPQSDFGCVHHENHSPSVTSM